MGLTAGRVERLLEEHADRLELEKLTQTHVPNARLRWLFERRREIDPTFTIASLARRAGYHRINVARWLGYLPTSPTTRNGRTSPARILTTVHVDKAGRLARAMGYAPWEVDRL
jgi:hypothetical protein